MARITGSSNMLELGSDRESDLRRQHSAETRDSQLGAVVDESASCFRPGAVRHAPGRCGSVRRPSGACCPRREGARRRSANCLRPTCSETKHDVRARPRGRGAGVQGICLQAASRRDSLDSGRSTRLVAWPQGRPGTHRATLLATSEWPRCSWSPGCSGGARRWLQGCQREPARVRRLTRRQWKSRPRPPLCRARAAL